MKTEPSGLLSERLRQTFISKLWLLWMVQPRSLFLRRALFQVHLFCGLAIGLVFAVIGVSGSAIVFKDRVDSMFNPQLLGARLPAAPRIAAGGDLAQRLLERAQHVHPDWHVLLLDTGTHRAWAFYLAKGGWDDGARVRTVYVDPSTAAILGERGLHEGVFNWLMALHTELLAGSRGTTALGVLASLFLVMVVSGVLLWWPGKRRWRDGLRINPKARWPRKIWDLHNVIGIFSSLSLGLQAATALILTLPVVVLPVLLFAMPQAKAEIERFRVPTYSHAETSSAATRRISLDTLIAESLRCHPSMRLNSVAFPADAEGVFLVTLGGAHFDDRGSQARLAFDQYHGTLLSDIDTERGSRVLKAFVMIGPWHYGHVAGAVSGCLWLLLGLCPGLLFLTGVLMWWRRVPSKRLQRLRTARSGEV